MNEDKVPYSDQEEAASMFGNDGYIAAAEVQSFTGPFDSLEHTGGGCYTGFVAGHAIGPFVMIGNTIMAHPDDLSVGPEDEA